MENVVLAAALNAMNKLNWFYFALGRTSTLLWKTILLIEWIIALWIGNSEKPLAIYRKAQ